MKPRWPAAVLVAGLLASSTVSAGAAQGPVRSQTLRAGAYTLRVDLYSDPPFTGRRFDFDVLVSSGDQADLGGVTLTASAVPDTGTNATASRATVSRAGPSIGGFRGYVTMPVRGSWFLRFAVDGSAGNNTVDLPLQVAAPTAIPIWLAWAIGLAPLLGLLGFAAGQRSYLARLQQTAYPGRPGASAPAAT